MTKIRIMLVLFMVVLLWNNIVFANEKVEIYGDDNYPPYSYNENDEPKGIYVDILELAFSNMSDYDVTIKVISWKRGLTLVKQGKALALFPPYYTEKRTPWMLFSEPILKEQVVVFGTSEKLKGKTNWPEDFYGSKVGLNQGFNPYSMGGDTFGDAHKNNKIEIEEAANNELNLKKLEAGRLDFYINDKLIDISPYPTIERGIVANTNYGYLGFTKKEGVYGFKADFINKFNEIIKTMKESGEIQKIVDSYIK